jgi:hypothetical protein
MGEQGLQHGRHEEQPRDAVRLDETKHLGGLEAGEEDVLAPEPGHVVRGAPTVDVEERDGVQDHVLAGERVREGRVDRVEVEVAMGEDDALGVARGAARVEELRR